MTCDLTEQETSKMPPITFLIEKDFRDRYPIGSKIHEGSSGKVYQSSKDSSIAIKIQEGDFSSLETFVNEINYLSIVDHPNIIKPFHWSLTYQDGKYRSFLAMPKGIPVLDALQNQKITFWQFAKDILGAIAYLHQHMICHGDLKENNIVYCKGKVCLIDLGHTIACLYREGMISMRYVRINPYYNDPEYYPGDDNPIQSELFSIGVILARIWQRLNGQNSTSPMFDVETCISSKYKKERDLIADLTRFPISNRDIAEVIFMRHFHSSVEGDIEELTIEDNDPDTENVEYLTDEEFTTRLTNDEMLFHEILSFQHRICKEHNQTNRILFLSFHLYRTAYAIKLFETPEDIRTHRIYALMYIYLANMVYDLGSRHHITEEKILKIFPDFTPRHIVTYLTQALIMIRQMILSETYWDYAKAYEELPILLNEMTSYRYTIRLIPKTDIESGISKDYPDLIDLPFGPSVEVEVPDLQESRGIQPIHQSEPDINEIIHTLTKRLTAQTMNRFEISAVIHYRDYLQYVPIKTVVGLWKKMSFDAKTLTDEDITKSLKVMFGYDPRSYDFDYVRLNLHPSTTPLESLKRRR